MPVQHLSEADKAEIMRLWESGLYTTITQVREAFHELNGKYWSTMAIARAIDARTDIPRKDWRADRSAHLNGVAERVAECQQWKEVEARQEADAADPRYPPFLERATRYEAKPEQQNGKPFRLPQPPEMARILCPTGLPVSEVPE